MHQRTLSLYWMLCAASFIILFVQQQAEGFFFGSRNPRQRSIVYYVCLNYDAVDSTQASECVYCPQRQTLACTGITGPPLQVTRSQANCLTSYCSSSVVGGGLATGGAAVPVSTRRRRRRSLQLSNRLTQQIDVDTTVLLRDEASRSSDEMSDDALLSD